MMEKVVVPACLEPVPLLLQLRLAHEEDVIECTIQLQKLLQKPGARNNANSAGRSVSSMQSHCLITSPVVQYSLRVARSASTWNSSGHWPSE